MVKSAIVGSQGRDFDERREIAEIFAKFHKTLGERGWFTLREYQKFLECEVLKPREREFIEYLVGWGGLSLEEDIYTPTDKFAGLLAKFAKA